MIIAHCPQFLCPEKPQMINFECRDKDGFFQLAKIDLGRFLIISKNLLCEKPSHCEPIDEKTYCGNFLV